MFATYWFHKTTDSLAFWGLFGGSYVENSSIKMCLSSDIVIATPLISTAFYVPRLFESIQSY